MTYITTTQIAVRGVRVPSLRAKLLDITWGIGRLLMACGRVFAGLSKAYVSALELAYVRPVGVSAQKQQLAPDADLEGRDPNW